MELLDLLLGPLLVLLGLVACYFLVWRPFRKMFGAAPPKKKEGQAESLARMLEELEKLDLPQLKMTDQERIRRLAKSNPDKARELVRLWINQDKAGKRH